MSDFLFACPTVPVVRGSEVRFSVDTHRMMSIPRWPLNYQSCGEIMPVQPRVQWGVPTPGARYDSFSGLRIGSVRNNLTLGARTTYASGDSRIGAVERQRVGVVSLTLGGLVRFKYWNDHAFWWWPMGDGGDQGDTAGMQFGYNVGHHRLSVDNWTFEDLSLTMRLATGIPNRSSAVPMGDGQVYTEVRFSEINRGDVDLSLRMSNRRVQSLTVGITANAGTVTRHTQGPVHRALGIAEFPRTDQVEVMVYLRLTDW